MFFLEIEGMLLAMYEGCGTLFYNLIDMASTRG